MLRSNFHRQSSRKLHYVLQHLLYDSRVHARRSSQRKVVHGGVADFGSKHDADLTPCSCDGKFSLLPVGFPLPASRHWRTRSHYSAPPTNFHNPLHGYISDNKEPGYSLSMGSLSSERQVRPFNTARTQLYSSNA